MDKVELIFIIYIYIFIYINYIYIYIYIYILYIYIYIYALNSFWKNMTKFSFMCDEAAMEVVKLDIQKQRYSLFIKCYILNLILLGVAFPAFESKNFLFQSLAWNVFRFRGICKFFYNEELCAFFEKNWLKWSAWLYASTLQNFVRRHFFDVNKVSFVFSWQKDVKTGENMWKVLKMKAWA